MKTTIELPEDLFNEARQAAERDGLTLRELVEQGLRLRLALTPRTAKKPGFALRDGSYGEGGLTPEFQDAGWEKIREAIYGDRGG